MKRRRKRKLKNSFKYIIVFLLLIISFSTYKIYFNKPTNEIETNTKTNTNKENKVNKPVKDEVYKLKLLATGDGLIHNMINVVYGNNGNYDFSPALSYVKDIVKQYDIAYYNQETPTGDNSIPYSGYPRFYTPSAYPSAMWNIGFNTVSLASNHSFDRGEQGVLNTLKYFKTTDYLYSGMNESDEATKNYQIKEKNNITYTLLSYTTIDNGLSTPQNKKYLVNKFDKERVKNDINAVRDSVDVLIVAMHWGIEYIDSPNAEELEIAQFLADLGVDIVIGNHPHILQPITKINDTIVMYSLGNFISNQYGTNDYNKLIGFMATLDITKTIKPNKETTITFDNLGGELIFTKYDGNPISTAVHYNHKVIPFSIMKDDTYLKDYEKYYNKYTTLLKSMGCDLNITPLPTKEA